ncbi:Phosphatidate cytidylyltransferase [Planctomycetes bacterium Pla163]|uniref:Phosphatidate cytidylyltransferase n=1 Tax=Rohdeia mirabilis TaxID=2528008 RepID=A0A518D362_9BACT|nr:Phosphatidate cytidylyltransferase [Planctomycetes bacterium Pla163]
MSGPVGADEAGRSEPAPKRSKAASIWRRTRTGAALVGVLALSFWATAAIGSSWPVFAIGGLLAAATLFEVGRMGRLRGRGWTAPLAVGLVAAAAVWIVRDSLLGAERVQDSVLSVAAAVYVAAGLAAFAVGLATRAERPHLAAALALWIVPPLPLLAEVYGSFERAGHPALAGLGALILLSKIGDIAGYYAGNALGRHHPFKKLSPGKTTEGCLASFLVGAAAGPACTALGLFPPGLDTLSAILIGATVNLAAQSGDLLESWVKRRVQVKDSSTWLGASGGMLDVCDSLLVTVPVALVTWPLLIPA